jgi:hypothetical protein
MTYCKPIVNDRFSRLGWASVLCVGFVCGVSVKAAGQTPPPVQGTMALEGTMKTFYRAVNTVVVATIDGIDHAYHFTTDLVVHGGKGTGVDALAGLREGTTVVVHYTVSGNELSATEIDTIGDEGLKITEGVVERIDRRRKEITIRFDNGKTETLRLTDRAAAEGGKDLDRNEAQKVRVYYADEGGQRVAHYFKKIS